MLCAPGKKGGEMMEFDPPPSREKREEEGRKVSPITKKKVFSFLGRMGSGNRAHTVCARVPGKCICLRNFNRTEEGLLFFRLNLTLTSPKLKKAQNQNLAFSPLPFPLKTHVLLLFFSLFLHTHTLTGKKTEERGV